MIIYEPKNRLEVSTPMGNGVVWLVTDYGHETDTVYTVLLDSCQMWQFTHKDIRLRNNITFNRDGNSKKD